jgi:8-oxo-dGTP diphosphatase
VTGPDGGPQAAGSAIDPAGAQVRAAGGVVWRPGPAGPEVVVVHRPHRGDWSLPKGKIDPGESLEQTARREVEEETGYRCTLGPALGVWTYRDHKQRPKAVWYWAMEATGGAPALNDEVDDIRWLDLDSAARRVDYDTDRAVLRRFAEWHSLAERRGDHPGP